MNKLQNGVKYVLVVGMSLFFGAWFATMNTSNNVLSMAGLGEDSDGSLVRALDNQSEVLSYFSLYGRTPSVTPTPAFSLASEINTRSSVKVDTVNRHLGQVNFGGTSYLIEDGGFLNPITSDEDFDNSSIQNHAAIIGDGVMVVYTSDSIRAYVLDGESAVSVWDKRLDDDVTLYDVAIVDETLQLITSVSDVVRDMSCMTDVILDDGVVENSCLDILYPRSGVAVNGVYTVTLIDIKTGEMGKQFSFVGGGDTTIYRGDESLYLGYGHSSDIVTFFSAFADSAPDIFPKEIRERLTQLEKSSISERAKVVELQVISEELMYGLSSTEIAELSEVLREKSLIHLEEYKREYQKTTLVKIDMSQLSVTETSQISGDLFGRMSLYENNDVIYASVAVGSQMWGVEGSGPTPSVEYDMYALNSSLEEVGVFENYSDVENIHSVRFSGDKGYYATFEMEDDIKVIDFSDVSEITKVTTGLVGYVSYLYPTEGPIFAVRAQGEGVEVVLVGSDYTEEISSVYIDDSWLHVRDALQSPSYDGETLKLVIPAQSDEYVLSIYNGTLEFATDSTEGS